MTPSFNLRVASLVRHLRRNEDGVISIVTVFVLLGLTMTLLGMINIARQIDAKVRRQNAVDAATRSAAGNIARGMNAVAFANHLEADAFAIAALLYGLEGTDTPWTAQYAPLRPVFEQMLAERAISEFRWDVILTTPLAAQYAMGEMARRHGLRQSDLASEQQSGAPGDGASSLSGVLWSSDATAVASSSSFNPRTRDLPVIDVDHDGVVSVAERGMAESQRNSHASRCLSFWLTELDQAFQNLQQPMPANIRSRSRERLSSLLNDVFPAMNLPAVTRASGERADDLDFIGVVYGQHRFQMAPRMYRNPLEATSTALAYAQARVFLPRSRLQCCPWIITYTDADGRQHEVTNTDGWPESTNTFNQNWSVQLVPARSSGLLDVLQTPPDTMPGLLLPNLQGLTPSEFQAINTH
jgi:hypothetical protein